MLKKKEKPLKLNARSKALLYLGILFIVSFFFNFASADPNGPDGVNVTANETRGAVSPYTLNTSGGYITTINITPSTQNPRWMAFVGHVIGAFPLDDSTGSTIYDWSVATTGGEVYATRNSSTITWSNIKCTNKTLLETENTLMSHTSSNDNITKTFNGTTHDEFFVGVVNISLNSCINATLNTYINNVSQDTDFIEVALTDSTNFTAGGKIIYTAILENNVVGFDGVVYDFQMIVPEIGTQGFTGSTAYYLYVELS